MCAGDSVKYKNILYAGCKTFGDRIYSLAQLAGQTSLLHKSGYNSREGTTYSKSPSVVFFSPTTLDQTENFAKVAVLIMYFPT